MITHAPHPTPKTTNNKQQTTNNRPLLLHARVCMRERERRRARARATEEGRESGRNGEIESDGASERARVRWRNGREGARQSEGTRERARSRLWTVAGVAGRTLLGLGSRVWRLASGGECPPKASTPL